MGLICDVSVRESDRIYGKEWPTFLGRCRAVLGTASGASIVDFDGKVENATTEYLIANPAASYDEIFDKILAPYEGKVVIDTISPRVFEAAVTRTAQILFESPYAGVIEPWVHYIPLKRDFSNMAEVAELIRDDTWLEKLTDQAHADLVDSGRYSYARLVRLVDDVLIEEVVRQRIKGDRTVPSARYDSGDISSFTIAGFFYTRIFPVLTGAFSYIRLAKLLFLILSDLIALNLAIAILAKNKAGTAQLRAAIPELGRIAILRRKRVRGQQSGRIHSVATILKDGIIRFQAVRQTENKRLRRGTDEETFKRFAVAFAEGRIKRILWQARLPIEDRPEFLEGASPINSIYEFERLTLLGKEFPTLVARLVAFNVSSIAADVTGEEGGNIPF